MLGWVIDTVAETLELPPHRLQRLHSLLDDLGPPRERMAPPSGTKCWANYASMSLAIPGSTGLFSVLQDTLRRGDQYRVRLTRHVHACSHDFCAACRLPAHAPHPLPGTCPPSPPNVGV
jgi:hypothetical protein